MSANLDTVLHFYIPTERVPNLNRIYSGMHWSKRSKLAHEWHELVWAVLVENGMLSRNFDKPVKIDVNVLAKRPPDPDNIGLVAKVIIDGLRHCNILRDDTYKEVAEVRLRSGKPTKEMPVGIYVWVWEDQP